MRAEVFIPGEVVQALTFEGDHYEGAFCRVYSVAPHKVVVSVESSEQMQTFMLSPEATWVRVVPDGAMVKPTRLRRLYLNES